MWLAGLVCFTSTVCAAIKTEVIEYREGDTVLEGFVAYDTDKGARPASTGS